MNFLNKFRLKSNSQTKSEKGFSLIELLVAMVIFLVVTGSIYGLLSMGRVSRNRSSRRTDVLKNARAAIHLIGRDTLNAGLGYHQKGAIVPDDLLSDVLELPVDADSERDILTAVIAGDDLFPNDLLDATTDRTDIIAFAYRDIDFNGGDAIDLKSTGVGSNPADTRLELGGSSSNPMRRYDLYLVEAGNTQVAVMASDIFDNKNFDLMPGDPLGLNLPYDGIGVNGTLLKLCNPPTLEEQCITQISSAKKINWVSYRVKQDGTLVRIVYGNNTGGAFDEQIREQPLAYNVKDLQFEYVLADGTVTSNPAAGADGTYGTSDDKPNDFNLIRQVTVNIQVQSTERDEQTLEPEILELDATFSLRNLQYDVG